ncbi:MAG: FeoA family protein [Acutalibacteraceae bacterium]
MPIVLAPLFKRLSVTRIIADDKLKRHLENIGLSVNSEVEVLSVSGGSIICRVKDGRLALDKQMATKIFVTVKED